MFRLTLSLCLIGLTIATPNDAKIERRLQSAYSHGKARANILVKFKGGNTAALQGPSTFSSSSRKDSISALVSNLKFLSEATQERALGLLSIRSRSSLGATYSQLWVSNELFVDGADEGLVQRLASLPEVKEIREELVFQLDEIQDDNDMEVFANEEWNIKRVQATGLPGGNTGGNVVVGNIDTGVSVTHEALQSNHRADYGWFDPFLNTATPNDLHGHGTHTMGTLAGSKGIGVAPGSKWIACAGCDSAGRCHESSLKRCGQWILCPTLPNGTQPDCSKAPRVVSNSWGSIFGGLPFYNDVINAWKAANIVPVFSIGNSGPTCGSATSPGDQEVIGVGSTNATDFISRFSSVGPSVENKMKPDIAAPGERIRSAWKGANDAYRVISGTSMACPHVAGAAAILLSKNPNLTYDQVKDILLRHADKNVPDNGKTCGGIPSTQIPNHLYGHGILNVRRALENV